MIIHTWPGISDIFLLLATIMRFAGKFRLFQKDDTTEIQEKSTD